MLKLRILAQKIVRELKYNKYNTNNLKIKHTTNCIKFHMYKI